LTWHTTPEFISHFNLESLKDLPGLDELKAAGLLDARPVMSNLPRDADDDASADPVEEEDNDFAAWVRDETEMDVAVAE
jgi:segregation and condensation protein B